MWRLGLSCVALSACAGSHPEPGSGSDADGGRVYSYVARVTFGHDLGGLIVEDGHTFSFDTGLGVKEGQLSAPALRLLSTSIDDAKFFDLPAEMHAEGVPDGNEVELVVATAAHSHRSTNYMAAVQGFDGALGAMERAAPVPALSEPCSTQAALIHLEEIARGMAPSPKRDAVSEWLDTAQVALSLSEKRSVNLSVCVEPVPAASTPSAAAPGSEQAQPPAAPTVPSPDTDAAITDPPGAELARSLAARVHALSVTNPPRKATELTLGNLAPAENGVPQEPSGVTSTHDRKSFAFIRREHGVNSIWLAAADGTGAHAVFDFAVTKLQLPDDDGFVDVPATPLWDLQFSPDDKQLYFQTEAWATSLALYRLDLGRQKAHFVGPANGYLVISACPKKRAHQGDLVTYRHSYDILLATAFDAYLLLDPKGHEQGLIGQQPSDVERFLSNLCAQGPAVPLPPQPMIEPQLLKFPECGAGGVLRYEPVRFLDGSALPFFYIVKKSRAHVRKLTLDDALSPPIPLDAFEHGIEAVCSVM